MDLLTLFANNPKVSHSNAQPTIIKLNIGFISVTDAIIILRLLVRWLIVKHVAVEDYLMIGAGLFATAFSAMSIVGTHYGLGRHIYDLPPATLKDNVKQVIQTLWICQVMYCTALTLVKVSILSTYLRIFPTTWVRYTMHSLAGFIGAVWIVNIVATVFQCTPIRATWDFEIQNRHCISIMRVYYFSTAFSILTDLILCLLPLPLFWRLKLPTREKWIVSMLFGLGLFASVASVMRITVLHAVESIDATSRPVPTLNWSVVEVGTGAILASLPCLKPLAKKLLPGMFSTTANHAGHTDPAQNGSSRGRSQEAAGHGKEGIGHLLLVPKGTARTGQFVRMSEYV